MLRSVDRVQLATRDRNDVVERWRRLVGAEVVRQDRVAVLGALRSVLRVGCCEVEILEADGDGPVARHVEARGASVFAAGLATRDLAAMRARLEARGVRYQEEANQLFADAEALGIPGLSVVVSEEEERPAAGLLRNLYEVTHLTPDAVAAASGISSVFGLDDSNFVPIRSEAYGYEGSLTLFDPGRLDRIESIHPFDRGKTMGRFFEKHGPCLYMCYGEADDVGAIRENLLEHASGGWTGEREGANPDGLFIHPKALGGVMLGVSRTTVGWTWSGSPDRVQRA